MALRLEKPAPPDTIAAIKATLDNPLLLGFLERELPFQLVIRVGSDGKCSSKATIEFGSI